MRLISVFSLIALLLGMPIPAIAQSITAAAAPLRTLPLVVLTRVRPLDPPSGFSADAFERAWTAGQTELATLVPGSRHVIATENGHAIQLDQPELVIEAIRQVVAAVRDPASWSTPAASPSPAA